MTSTTATPITETPTAAASTSADAIEQNDHA